MPTAKSITEVEIDLTSLYLSHYVLLCYSHPCHQGLAGVDKSSWVPLDRLLTTALQEGSMEGGALVQGVQEGQCTEGKGGQGLQKVQTEEVQVAQGYRKSG